MTEAWISNNTYTWEHACEAAYYRVKYGSPLHPGDHQKALQHADRIGDKACATYILGLADARDTA